MRLGIFAKTFPGTTPDVVIAAACAAGFSAVQYNMACSGIAPMPDAIPDATAKAVSTAAGRAGVETAAVSGTYNMIHPHPAVRAKGLARLDILARSCASLGTPLITLCTGTRDPDDQWRRHPDNDTPEAWRDLLTEITKAIAIADLYGVDLCIEPELANVINSAAKARRLIDELSSPRLKIVLDAANLFEAEPLQRQRDIVSAAIDILADRIVMGHAKDRTSSGAFTTAGQGVLDYAHYVAKLHAVGLRNAAQLMPAEISGGMARRVALARAIALDPQLIMYDEPFAGLDPISMGVTANLIRRLNDVLGSTSILVSHDVNETFLIADYVYFLSQGKIVAQGTPDVLRDSTDPYVRQFVHAEADGPVPFHYPGATLAADLGLDGIAARESAR